MASSGHSTLSRERRGVEHITRYSPGNSPNEEFGQELCMVAKHGHKFIREGEQLCYLSESPKDPFLFAITPLGMAGPPLVATARRLCGSFYGKDVLADHLRLFQVNGYPLCELCYLQCDHRQMKSTLAAHGLPEIVVSDNRSNFVIGEFKLC